MLLDYERTGVLPAPNLERVAAIAAALGNPQHAFPSIHVTGTNGKGSTVAMTAALLAATGRRVGTYTSPHLHDVTERITVDGRPVDGWALEWALAEVTGVAERLGITPSWFEAMTLSAFLLLAEARVDAAVIEVGMLGRWDATNVIDGRVAVVTNVAADHLDAAGPTLADVAYEKAGIVRRGAPLILGPVTDDLRPVFEAERPWRIRELGRDLDELDVPLPGRHQRANAALARAAAEAFLDAPLPDELVHSALTAVRLPGRFEVCPLQMTSLEDSPGPQRMSSAKAATVVLDGAHNPAAAAALRATLDDEFPRPGRRILVAGALAGRDLEAYLRALGVDDRAFDAVVMTAPPSVRAVPPTTAAEIAADVFGKPVPAAADVRDALDLALELAGDGVVLVTGSLYLVDPARSYVRCFDP